MLTGVVTKLVNHQCTAIIQVQRHPIPARLIVCKGLGTPLTIEPTFARNFDGLFVNPKRPGNIDKGLTVVITRLSQIALLAVAVVSLQHPVIRRRKRKRETLIIRARRQLRGKR